MTRPGERVAITPATKVSDLLESWPELEDVLVAQAPAFRRLRNPVLRRTVARVATLEQAAGVGGVAVRDLVGALRRAAGLDDADLAGTATAHGAGTTERVSAEEPSWLAQARVVGTIEADALLDAGEVPLARVNANARALKPGEALRVVSGFRPVPLVEALAKQGLRCVVRETVAGRFETFVAGPGEGP